MQLIKISDLVFNPSDISYIQEAEEPDYMNNADSMLFLIKFIFKKGHMSQVIYSTLEERDKDYEDLLLQLSWS